MNLQKKQMRIVLVGPDSDAHGGISAVISTYRKTSFWQEFNCSHFASTRDIANPLARKLYNAKRLLVFAGALLNSRPSVVSIHTSQKGSFYRKLAYILISRLYRIPVVLHVHPAAFSDFYKQGNRARKFAINIAGRLSDKIIFLSHQNVADFRDIFSPAKLGVLANPVDIDEYDSETPVRNKRQPRVLFLGWIIREKGVYDLVDAIPWVLEDFPDVLFTFAGNKEVQRLRELISSRSLSAHAEVLGWVEGKTKVQLLRTSSILVLPSYSEGIPNVILEAMASNLPIVTTPVGGIPGVLKHGETAIFVKPGNVRSIADGIKKLLSDPVQASSLAQSAFTRVKDNYSIATIGNDLREIYAPYLRIEGATEIQDG